MFEILQAYETARHEKNKLLRFFLVRHVRRKLKKLFFNKFTHYIMYNEMKLNKELLNEFYQFFACTKAIEKHETVGPHIIDVIPESNSIHINFANYHIKYTFLENTCDIDIRETINNKSVLIHPDIERVYSHYFGEILLMAIYNYCVTYIYGIESDLYIHCYIWLGTINSMYFS